MSWDLQLDSGGVPRNPVVVVDAEELEQAPDGIRPIVIAISNRPGVASQALARADLVIGTDPSAGGSIVAGDPAAAAAALVARIIALPSASVALAWLLRASHDATVVDALAAESAVYSTLLGGAQFRRWLGERGAPRPVDGDVRVRLRREGNRLLITLARPARRNAVDARMRDALLEALHLAEVDDDLEVEIDADGPCFCAGGDLDEFGTATDLAAAHLIRVGASVGQKLHDLSGRVTVRVHGACIGAGIELPAFARHVIATDDAYFGLPEVSMGLIPGAGGTVSVTRRIGRQRTFWLAVSGEVIDASTALTWGLVDELSAASLT